MADGGAAPMAGKTALVTGANTGIGKVVAGALAALGARVVVAARDAAKGEAAVAEIRRETGNEAVELVVADFSSLAAVRKMAGEIMAGHQRLDVLVNNAGLILGRRSETADGFETMFAVNHLAPFLLTHLLRPLLEASAPARVVNVASAAHQRGALNFDDLQSRASFSPFGTYGATKLANILFTRSLARRLAGSGVTANACHPGVVATGFAMDGDTGGLFRFFYALARPFLLSPRKGAQTLVYLASAPDVAGINGLYYVKNRPRIPSARARDDQVAERLWQVSAEMTGIA